MGYRTVFIYPTTDARTQRSLEVWLCYFLRPLLPKDIGWEFQEPPGELRIELTWADAALFTAWYQSDRCQAFREAHGGRELPRLRVRRPPQAAESRRG